MTNEERERIVKKYELEVRTNINKVDMGNYKPYRTKTQKIQARKSAVLCDDGAWRSNAPVSYHERKKPG